MRLTLFSYVLLLPVFLAAAKPQETANTDVVGEAKKCSPNHIPREQIPIACREDKPLRHCFRKLVKQQRKNAQQIESICQCILEGKETCILPKSLGEFTKEQQVEGCKCLAQSPAPTSTTAVPTEPATSNIPSDASTATPSDGTTAIPSDAPTETPTPSPIPPPGEPVQFNPAVPMSYEKCRLDPESDTLEFEPIDRTDGINLMNIDGYAVKNMEPKEGDPPTPAWYRFERPSGAPAGAYDIVVTLDSGKKYLALYENGRIGFVDSSSNGQDYAENDGKKYVTSIFFLSCEANLSLGFKQGAEYQFLIFNNAVYAYPKTGEEAEQGELTDFLLYPKFAMDTSEDPHALPYSEEFAMVPPEPVVETPEAGPEEVEDLPADLLPKFEDDDYEIPSDTLQKRSLPAVLRSPLADAPEYSVLSKRVDSQSGVAPRCIARPPGGLIAVNKDEKRSTPNGCGAENGMPVPDLIFTNCCNIHDQCFDNCGKGFEDCNNEFRDCMVRKCHDTFPWWLLGTRQGCEKLAHGYAWAVGTPFGANAFYVANVARCNCVCKQGSFCNYNCQSFDWDNNNCGACGTQCINRSTCQAGRCLCPNNGMACRSSNGCTDVSRDSQNCGYCGIVCPAGTTCQNSKCVCPAGHGLCSGGCRPLNYDNKNCGACGVDCGPGSTCDNGKCSCGAGLTKCPGGACRNLQDDPKNCGTCGKSCISGMCSAGVCVPPPAGRCEGENLPANTAFVWEGGAYGIQVNVDKDPASCCQLCHSMPGCAGMTYYPGVEDRGAYNCHMSFSTALGMGYKDTCPEQSRRLKVWSRQAPGQFMSFGGCFRKE